jgi:hypothetical protein
MRRRKKRRKKSEENEKEKIGNRNNFSLSRRNPR